MNVSLRSSSVERSRDCGVASLKALCARAHAGKFALVGLLFLSGCMTPGGPRGGAGVGMTDALLPIDDARAERVLADYRDVRASREGLRGSARVALSGPDFKLNRPQRIIVKRPAKLRFEVVGLFDQLAAVLATDGEEFSFYEAGQPEIARGLLSPGLLWDLAKIDLEPAELVGLLLGTPAPSPGAARAAVWLEPPGGEEAESRLAVAFAWPEAEALGRDCFAEDALGASDVGCFVSPDAIAMGAEVFVFDEGSRLVEMRAVEAGGALRFRAEFADYRGSSTGSGSEPPDSGVSFPNRVTIGSPQQASEARFLWKRVMLSNELSDQHFRIPERAQRRPSAGSGGG